MVKVAAIDCGSNSTRLLIADVSSGELIPLYKHIKLPKPLKDLKFQMKYLRMPKIVSLKHCEDT